MDLSKIEFGASMKKECFHFEEGFTYVNHGAYGEVPLKIRGKQKQLLDAQNDNTGKFFRETTPQMFMTAIDAAAKFLGADPTNLVFVQNATTDKVNSILKSFPWKKGDEILASIYTYKAVEYACRRVAEFSTGGQIHQFDIRFPIKDEMEVINSMTSHLDKYPRVRLVVIDHISSPTALMFPIKRMISECMKRGVWVLIDGAHAPGQVDIKLEELNPDFYVANFHKWMYTPRGCGVLWVRKEHHDWCTPLVTSFMYKKGFQLEYFVQGTRDDIPYFLIPDSIQFYQDVGGREKITKYTTSLLDKASVLIAERLNTEVLQIPKSMEAPGMRLVLLPEFEGYEKTWEGSEKLFLDITNKHRLNCAIYPAQGELYLRLSANIYNEMIDYENTADLLRQLTKK